MKHIYMNIFILSVVLSTVFQSQAQAQTKADGDNPQAEIVAPYKHQGSMGTAKTVTPNDNGTFTITLETFAEGSSSYEDKSKPADIVLVLDVSGSMKEPYLATESKVWRGNDISSYGKALYYREWNSTNNWYDYYGPLRYSSSYGIYGSMVAGGSGTKYLGDSYTGELYSDVKLDAMKDAIYDFIDQLDINDRIGPNGKVRNKRLGNRIAIVTFSNQRASKTVRTLTYLGNSSLDINNSTGKGNLESDIEDLTAGGGTYVDEGIQKAGNLFGSTSSLKTVVVFTDGNPGDGKWSSSDTGIANNAISYANTIKGNNGANATVWTIGVFEDMTPENKAKTDTYMNRVSSNYVNVTNMTTTATPVNDKYYIEVGEGTSLADAFKAVAEASGGSDSGADSYTEIKDAVTSSFVLPDNATAQSINLRFYTQNIATDGKSWGGETEVTVAHRFDKITSEADGKQHNALVITGFDFAKDDTKKDNGETNGDGNWVGLRYKLDGSSYYAGKKLVVKFDVTANPEATGGNGTATNTSESGVYVRKLNPDGTTYSYVNVNSYEIPHTPLPVNIRIQKSGLRSGESATFEVFRIKPLVVDGVVQYNAIGKPLPNENEYTPVEGDGPGEILEGKGWEKWSKVIITNTTPNYGEVLSRTLICLDPSWIYAVVEDQWGWAYTITGEQGSVQNTSDVEINPFKFKNEEKTDAVKHAEAVTINHFNLNGEYTGEQEEHYKSSKVKSF